ncbi:hypothetical protein LTR85_001079 [Meristemomyces frigidus]|nr:hypothetical protein LTR85_001079 [Meristemomyces frigidus]
MEISENMHCRSETEGLLDISSPDYDSTLDARRTAYLGEHTSSTGRDEGKTINSRIRTGCIPCLRDGMYCNGTNRGCQKRAASEEWRCNRGVAWQWHGTWRERRSFHVFIDIATSPQRAGLFESNFWHRTVLLAASVNKAIYHFATAIGALHEQITSRSILHNSFSRMERAFALVQCNRAIGLLTASASGETDPGVALITCVLFACFEALYGDQTQATAHFRQGRKLLQSCERLAATGQGSRLVEPAYVLPVMGGLEIQAKSTQKQPSGMPKPRQTEETAPLPDVSRMHSLAHANWTLQCCYISLLVYCQDCPLDSPPQEMAVLMATKSRKFAPWLDQREKAFANLLFREGCALSPKDLERAKVLKANHIIATALSTIDQNAALAAWDTYVDDFNAVIELSASVLNADQIRPSDTHGAYKFPFLTLGFWVAEPLFFAMARCTNAELRRRAAGLLLTQSGSKTQCVSVPDGVSAYVPKHHADEGGTGRHSEDSGQDTRCLSAERWIAFATSTRLDAGIATYFGQLPRRAPNKHAAVRILAKASTSTQLAGQATATDVLPTSLT